jgi:ribonuclease III
MKKIRTLGLFSLRPWITFQEKLEYTFKLPMVLKEALTHKSHAHESTSLKELFAHNERLEFLGDSVLDLCISSILMHRDWAASEGELSKRRASLVNEAVLADVARELELCEYIILGRGEMNSKGGDKNSILSSGFEAVLGAVYLDGGYTPARTIVERLFSQRILNLETSSPFVKDYKTRLQEFLQLKYKAAPQYIIEKTEGPEHQKIFRVAIMFNDQKMSFGVGRSRKEAEQDGARKVLEELNL